MPEKEIIEDEFDCHQANEIVTITREVLIHRSSSTGEIDMEKPISFDCDHAETCGVGKKSGRNMSYDWSKCIYPK